MDLVAVIIENRAIPGLNKIIQAHMDKLPGFDLLHLKPKIRTMQEYNQYITSPAFWQKLRYDKALIFQHDSWIRKDNIADFLNYDYIGAPWIHPKMPRFGGNGGLSLRTVNEMHRITVDCPYHFGMGNEDLYFSVNCQGKINGREDGKRFSVETIFYPDPWGWHCYKKYLKNVNFT